MMHRIALATEPFYREHAAAPVAWIAASRRRTRSPRRHHSRPASWPRSSTPDAGRGQRAAGHGVERCPKNRILRAHVGRERFGEHACGGCVSYWGVIPLAGAPTHDSHRLLRYVIEQGPRRRTAQSGDRIVLVAGTGIASSRHNMIVVHELA